MTYTITLKKRGIFGLTFKEKIKNVHYHNFPNDWNNSDYMLYVKIDGSRHILNLSQYECVDFPASAFLKQQAQNQQNLSEEQQKQLNNI
jgi:hypothetical protein